MTMVFTDQVGDPLTPQSVDYRIDDKTNGTEIVGWTSLPGPASTMNFTIAGDRNTIEDDVHVKEIQIFGIRLDFGLAGEAHSQLEYNVLNLLGPTGP